MVSFTPRPLYPGERAPGTHWIEGWVGHRADLDDVEKRKFLTLPELELRPLGRPARSQSLYRLRYPGSLTNIFATLGCEHLTIRGGAEKLWLAGRIPPVRAPYLAKGAAVKKKFPIITFLIYVIFF
jgi:hypothetical protein